MNRTELGSSLAVKEERREGGGEGKEVGGRRRGRGRQVSIFKRREGDPGWCGSVN